MRKIGFGGGCHWCTEAVFQSLIGVSQVDQGWIKSQNEADSFSEAVIVHYNPQIIPLSVLIEIHLRTHKSTVDHTMRKKYRSAIYVFSKPEEQTVLDHLYQLKDQFKSPIITQVLPFVEFKPSDEDFKNYYYKNPQKPFCETYIAPKLNLLLKQFTDFTNLNKLNSQ